MSSPKTEETITETELGLDSDEESYYEDSDESIDEENETPLSEVWAVWYHRLGNKDWSINGYERIKWKTKNTERDTFKTIEEFWRLYNAFIVPRETTNSNDPLLLRGDFFIMKEGILPTWEDPENLKGCSDSYLTKERTEETNDDYSEWLELALYLISNYGSNINGISSSPKQKNFLMKIWKGDCDDVKIEGGFQIDLTSSKRKIHKESAEKEKEKQAARHRRSGGRGYRGGGDGRYNNRDRRDGGDRRDNRDQRDNRRRDDKRDDRRENRSNRRW